MQVTIIICMNLDPQHVIERQSVDSPQFCGSVQWVHSEFLLNAFATKPDASLNEMLAALLSINRKDCVDIIREALPGKLARREHCCMLPSLPLDGDKAYHRPRKSYSLKDDLADHYRLGKYLLQRQNKRK